MTGLAQQRHQRGTDETRRPRDRDAHKEIFSLPAPTPRPWVGRRAAGRNRVAARMPRQQRLTGLLSPEELDGVTGHLRPTVSSVSRLTAEGSCYRVVCRHGLCSRHELRVLHSGQSCR